MVYTIGYEGKNIVEFINCLLTNGVNYLIDIRDKPISRKKGFSKTKLSEQCKEHGIVYHHIRELGTPKHLRYEVLEKQDFSLLYDYFEDIFDSRKEEMDLLVSKIQEEVVCLMCFEQDVEKCHRNIITAKLQEITSDKFSIVNL